MSDRLGLIERRHPKTWPCDDCGKNHAEVYAMPNGDLLCVPCELRARRAADHSQGAVEAERARIIARIRYVAEGHQSPDDPWGAALRQMAALLEAEEPSS